MGKGSSFIVIFAAAIALAACRPTTVEDPAKLKQQVEETTAAYWDTMLAGDYDKLPSFYTDDAVLMPHGNENMGIEGMMAQQIQGKEMGIKVDSYTPTVLDVWGRGDMVYEVGSYEMATSMEGMPESKSDHGSYMSAWQKEADGSLKRKYFIWNSAVVEQPAAPPVATFEGNWELMSVKGTYLEEGKEITIDMVKNDDNFGMKTIHDGFFMFSGQDAAGGVVTPHYGYGKYTVDNNVYTETITHHFMKELIGDTPSYEMTVDGDTLIQKGPLENDPGTQFTETYIRK